MAITLDNSTDLGSGTTSLTAAHTVSGSDRLLAVAIDGNTTAGGDNVSSVTYNGTAMTRLYGNSAGGRWFYLYYLLNPDTGSNNVVITNTGSDYTAAAALSYNGVLQTGQPDATNSASPGTTTNPTVTVTVVANNCIIIGVTRAAVNFTADSNTTEHYGIGNAMSFITSDQLVPSGNYTIGGTQDSGDSKIYGASFAPVPDVVTEDNTFYFM